MKIGCLTGVCLRLLRRIFGVIVGISFCAIGVFADESLVVDQNANPQIHAEIPDNGFAK